MGPTGSELGKLLEDSFLCWGWEWGVPLVPSEPRGMQGTGDHHMGFTHTSLKKIRRTHCFCFLPRLDYAGRLGLLERWENRTVQPKSSSMILFIDTVYLSTLSTVNMGLEMKVDSLLLLSRERRLRWTEAWVMTASDRGSLPGFWQPESGREQEQGGTTISPGSVAQA